MNTGRPFAEAVKKVANKILTGPGITLQKAAMVGYLLVFE